MNIYHQKLKKYMKLKGDKIKELTGIYFYCSDEAIESIKEPDRIWNLLESHIFIGCSSGIKDKLCPFCLEFYLYNFDSCYLLENYVKDEDDIENPYFCEWGKENGICNEEESSWRRVKLKMNKKFEKFGEEKLTNDFYKEIFKKVNKELDPVYFHYKTTCSDCNGTGKNKDNQKFPCFNCNGTGELIVESTDL